MNEYGFDPAAYFGEWLWLFLMGEDKRRAKAHKWRISEAHLWSAAVLLALPGRI